MPDYKEMYFTLLQAQLDVMELLEEAHQKAEAFYTNTSASKNNISIAKIENSDNNS